MTFSLASSMTFCSASADGQSPTPGRQQHVPYSSFAPQETSQPEKGQFVILPALPWQTGHCSLTPTMTFSRSSSRTFCSASADGQSPTPGRQQHVPNSSFAPQETSQPEKGQFVILPALPWQTGHCSALPM